MKEVYRCLELGKIGIFESPTGTVSPFESYIIQKVFWDRCIDDPGEVSLVGELAWKKKKKLHT